MSNFSKTFAAYLRGYIGSNALALLETQRELSAAALGVHHRTSSKPPLMGSVAVTAELRQLRVSAVAPGPVGALLTQPYTAQKPQPIRGDLILLAHGENKIAAIKAVREIAYTGLKEAKDIVDGLTSYPGSSGRPWIVLRNAPDRVEAAAKLLRDAGCTVEVQ